MLDLIEAHLRWCRAGGMSHNTVHDRAYLLGRMDAELPQGLESSSDNELEGWFANPGWSDWTRLTWFNHAWGFYSWAEGRYLDLNPMVGMRRPKAPKGLPRPIPDEHLAIILIQASEPFRLYAKIVALSGLRCCEIAQLDRRDVTSDRLLVRHGKGGKPAVLDTHPELWMALAPFPPGPIAELAGGVADARWISIRSTLHYQKRLGLPRGTSLHPVRHWYAEACRKAGADAITLQACMRHERLSTTQNYFLAGEAERRPVMTALRLPVAA